MGVHVVPPLSLSTERLILRDFVEDDWHAVHEYGSDEEVARFMDWGPNSEEETRVFVQQALESQRELPRKTYDLAATLGDTGRLIGGGRIAISDNENRQAEIGYVFGRSLWGRGYATETALSLLAFGFQDLDMHRIFATCDPENIASARVLEKIGMRREGHLREHRWYKQKWQSSYLYSILSREWR